MRHLCDLCFEFINLYVLFLAVLLQKGGEELLLMLDTGTFEGCTGYMHVEVGVGTPLVHLIFTC